MGQPIPGQAPIKPEDKPDTPEYKKKHAMLKGPILELTRENQVAYGMNECTFTALKDIFLALNESQSRTGVLSPQRFLEIFKRDNEFFRSASHQDAHEFYFLAMGDIHNRFEEMMNGTSNGHSLTPENLVLAKPTEGSPLTTFVKDIFEVAFALETKCLTCETTTLTDETFMALSIPLKEHSSVTSCLRRFSAEEMLCQLEKYHCDGCGGKQEAERRVKLKRLPKILVLHLNRFEVTPDHSRIQKLCHRVVYPYQLRLFNTADDTEDPDRLYELYAVVVHVGGNIYHGHYVSIIKTKDRGWLLFDDEMVEPVDKHFVRNFFGGQSGMATAYMLYYQETTFEKMREEQEAEGMEEVKLATRAANLAQDKEGSENGDPVPLTKLSTQPAPATAEAAPLAKLAHARTAPDTPTPGSPLASPSELPAMPTPPQTPGKLSVPTKEDKKREKKEKEAADKAAKELGKERDKAARAEEKRQREMRARAVIAHRMEQEQIAKALNDSKKTAATEEKERHKDEGVTSPGLLDRTMRGSKSSGKRSFGFFGKDKSQMPEEAIDDSQNGAPPEKQERKSRLSMGLGRKKSTVMS